MIFCGSDLGRILPNPPCRVQFFLLHLSFVPTGSTRALPPSADIMSVGMANLAIQEGPLRICSGGIAGQLQFGWDCHWAAKKALRGSGGGQFFW